MPADPWADERGYRTIHYAEFTEEVFRVPRVMVWLGTISYGVYLWHYPAAFYFRTVLPWYLTAPIVLSFSIAMAAASYFFIEGPLQTYRRSLRENRRAAHNKAVSAHGAAKTQSVAAAT